MSRLAPLAVLLAPLVALAELPAAPPPRLDTPGDTEAAFLAARRPVTLREAMALADRSSQDLVAARAAADQVAARARLVFSAVLPELTASASYVHTNAPQEFDIKLLPFDHTMDLTGVPTTVIVGRNSLYGTVIAQQYLFAPQFFLIPAADEANQAAHLGSVEAREQVLLGVARVYLNLEGLAQVERAARDAEQVALQREKDARSLAQAGVATDIALLRAQSETAQARALLAGLSGQRVALVAMLEALVGAPIRPIDDAPTQVTVTPADEASQPWENTWLLRSTAMGLRSQERFNTFDRLSWLPALIAQAKGSYNSNSGFADKNFVVDVSVSAQWALYDKGQRYVTLHENDAKTAEQRAKLESTRAKARATWRGARTNLQAAEVSLAESEAQAALATRAQKQVESAYRAGFSTSLEVSDVDSKRFLAVAGAANARAQLQLRRVELAAAEGRLAQVMGLLAEPAEPR